MYTGSDMRDLTGNLPMMSWRRYYYILQSIEGLSQRARQQMVQILTPEK